MKNLIAEFKSASLFKKSLVTLFLLTVIIMPFQAMHDAEQKAASAAEWNKLTPEQKKAHAMRQHCISKMWGTANLDLAEAGKFCDAVTK